MIQDYQMILVCSSRLLSYPSEEFTKELKEIDNLLNEELETTEMLKDWNKIVPSLKNISKQEIQELYVSTFDLRAKTGLYLTAHELGDSNRRGAALIRLQKIISKAGFERQDEELVDYIPMLLEFLAVAPESAEIERLEKRLAVALKRILLNIRKDNPYKGILNLLLGIFPNPTKEEVEKLEINREEADLEELPYPIMYQ